MHANNVTFFVSHLINRQISLCVLTEIIGTRLLSCSIVQNSLK